MTREEALDIETIDEAINNINKIYDDIENRVCRNCKWYNEPICLVSKCEDINELGQYIVRPTFGCNEWENKK